MFSVKLYNFLYTTIMYDANYKYTSYTNFLNVVSL